MKSSKKKHGQWKLKKGKEREKRARKTISEPIREAQISQMERKNVSEASQSKVAVLLAKRRNTAYRVPGRDKVDKVLF